VRGLESRALSRKVDVDKVSWLSVCFNCSKSRQNVVVGRRPRFFRSARGDFRNVKWHCREAGSKELFNILDILNTSFKI
jgi:hypothetical protein